ncbi:cellobiose dehydrogenase [Colletotrichum truncatum]|uniref:Cellobiose dehydrogenase n=1 Tax=Colletotrichum truncatum TaxID=5467 RepID=A0ACC3ZCY9_COLTU|nr:cellobiose dehydrogenase [Colletotrichum truncatum]KAF6797898.1 cellobiose dehydrogenase [Colletotrichum truncatum]
MGFLDLAICLRLLVSRLYALAVFFSAITIVLADDDATSTPAQQSAPFVDQATGLTMERFFGARTSFAFGMALPEQASGSFIGQLSFPLVNGAGWGAMGLTGEMEGNFILAAWPDGKGGVMASFRQATNEDNPPEVKGKFAVRPIAEGVSVNATSLTYTFLCENCLDATLGLGPEATNANAVMGWALSEKAVRNPENPGANLGFHERGFGPFTARLGNAKSAQFASVAATAGKPVAGSNRAVAATPNAFKNGGDDDDDDDEKKGGKDGGGKKGDDDDD